MSLNKDNYSGQDLEEVYEEEWPEPSACSKTISFPGKITESIENPK